MRHRRARCVRVGRTFRAAATRIRPERRTAGPARRRPEPARRRARSRRQSARAARVVRRQPPRARHDASPPSRNRTAPLEKRAFFSVVSTIVTRRRSRSRPESPGSPRPSRRPRAAAPRAARAVRLSSRCGARVGRRLRAGEVERAVGLEHALAVAREPLREAAIRRRRPRAALQFGRDAGHAARGARSMDEERRRLPRRPASRRECAPAAPSVRGRCSASFSRASRESAGERRRSRGRRESASRFVLGCFLDRDLLAAHVARASLISIATRSPVSGVERRIEAAGDVGRTERRAPQRVGDRRSRVESLVANLRPRADARRVRRARDAAAERRLPRFERFPLRVVDQAQRRGRAA